MSSVTNQLPYEEIKTPPVPSRISSSLIQLIERVVLAVTLIGFSAASGTFVALSNFSITIISGAMVGGGVGLVVSFALLYFMHFPSKLTQYRLDTLEKLEKATGNPRARYAFRNLKQFFHYPFKKFGHHYDHHLLHSELTAVTQAIDPQRQDVIKAWLQFLKHLNGSAITNADGDITPFSTEVQQALFSGKRLIVEHQWLSGWGGYDEDDLEQIAELSKSSFGKHDAFTKEQLEATLSQSKPSGCMVAREQNTGKILGYGFYYIENGILHIPQIARKPEAARLGIGLEILTEILRYNKGQNIQVTLRAQNPFIRRLQNFGFTSVQTLPKYYHVGPSEDGVLLQMDWSKAPNGL